MRIYIQRADFQELHQLFGQLYQLLEAFEVPLLLEKISPLMQQIHSKLQIVLAPDYPIIINHHVVQVERGYPKAWLTELDYINDYLQAADYEAAQTSAKLICCGLNLIATINSFGRNPQTLTEGLF